MAATGTPTTNIGLRRPQGTDPASVDDINYNSELIDTKLGAVGSTSVQEQINTLNSKLALSTLTITRTENSFVSATELARCSAYKRAGILCLNFNATLSGASMSDFVEVGVISGWSSPTSPFLVMMPQNGEAKPVVLQVSTSGSIKIYGSQGTAYSFYRGTVSICANN